MNSLIVNGAQGTEGRTRSSIELFWTAKNNRDTILTSRVVEASIDGQSTFGMEGTSQVPQPTCLRGPCPEGTNGGEKEKERKVEKLQIMEAASTLR